MRLGLLAFFGVVLFVSGAVQAQDAPSEPYQNPYPNPANPYPYPVKPEILENSKAIDPHLPVRPGEETSELPDGVFELCERKFDSIFFAFRDIRGDFELSFTEEDERYEYYEDYLNGLTWVLTKENFEAHPSIICKEIIVQHGKKLKSITMYCGADADTCERFQAALNGE